MVIFSLLNIFDLQLVEPVEVVSMDMEGQLYFKLCNLEVETISYVFLNPTLYSQKLIMQ